MTVELIPPTSTEAVTVALQPDADRCSSQVEISRWANSRRKRVLDIAVSVPLAVLTLPLILLLATGSAISYRAWPFFTQRRVGLEGHEFTFVKLRSLPTSAPTSAVKYELSSVDNTRWGRFLRRSKLDELPQVWLVTTGRMSLVGPRPEMPEIAATFDPIFVDERCLVRPGCTGPWQLSEAAAKLIGESPEYDRGYVRNASLRLDASLMLRTVGFMLGFCQPLPDASGSVG